MKPFVKWAGGKSQLLEKINIILPNNYERIVEPFVGGGAFFLNNKADEIIINDINSELMKTYDVIKNKANEFIKYLNKYEKNNSKIFFNEVRSISPDKLNSNLEIASRFIYLNKACFNGLYRVNSKGEFNVPFNNKENLKIYDKKNILNLSNYFKKHNLKIYNKSFEEIFKLAKKDDLFFIDPPYDKETKTTFTSYQKDKFDKKMQVKLFEEIKKLDKKGVKFILTNHDTPLINDLYKGFDKLLVTSNRMINSNGENRINSTFETIIFNFKISDMQRKEIEFYNFLDTMHSTNKKINNLIDWNKILINKNMIDYQLNQFNYLISQNKKELDEKIDFLYRESSQTFNFLPYLLALRDKSFSLYDLDNKLIEFNFNNQISLKKSKKLIFESELDNIFVKNVKNIPDYYLGVEVGMDTNARKNRSGHIYENLIEDLLKKYNINYEKEKYIKGIFSSKSKRADFLLNINNEKYILEVNFYNSGGSKLNAICGEYKFMDEKLINTEYKFIWVTDGSGWKKAKNDLKEAFLKLKNLFNFSTFEKWIVDNE